MTACQTIIFDLDDTLYPERQYVLSGFLAVARWAEDNLGIAAQAGLAELRRLFDQGVRGDTFDRWLAYHGQTEEIPIARLVNVYRNHEPELTPFPEARRILDSLRGPYRLGLLSDGHLAVQRRKLEALGLAHYFQAVVFSDEMGRAFWKPSTVPFKRVLRELQTAAAAAIYVGDNPTKDFVAARSLGMRAVRVRRDDGEYVHVRPPTPGHRPHVTIRSLDALPALLDAWE